MGKESGRANCAPPPVDRPRVLVTRKAEVPTRPPSTGRLQPPPPRAPLPRCAAAVRMPTRALSRPVGRSYRRGRAWLVLWPSHGVTTAAPCKHHCLIGRVPLLAGPYKG